MRLPFKLQPSSPKTDQVQRRLMRLAAAFLLLYAVILTLSPAVRLHSWQVPYRWTHWIGVIIWGIIFAFLDVYTQKRLPERDPYLLPVASLLSGWGLMTVWRISESFGIRQSIWMVVCMAALMTFIHLSDNLVYLRRYRYLWLTSGLLLTLLTFFFGTYPGGAGPRLWLGCCGVYFQPSEPLKLLLIVYLAAYLGDRLITQFSLLQLLTPTLLMAGVALVILLAQRDLGTSSLLIFIYAAVLYSASGYKRVLAVSFLFLSVAAVGAYFAFDVVRLRIDTWLNPWADPSGKAFQSIQSLLGIAAGGLIGNGPGLGSPGVVPVAHSDFIFTAIAEEAGLAGSIAVLLLIALLTVRGLRTAFYAPVPYQRYLAAGLTIYLAGQSIVIIGGNIRLFPLTGVTLPFVSYGGSSLLTSFLALGILLQISNQPDTEPAGLPDATPYMVLGSGILLGLFTLALLDGWWSIYRSQDLISRTENPRRSINDRYVPRGNLLDRNDQVLNGTSGLPGNYFRDYRYTALSPILGYTDATFGQAGLEATLDPYLRGTTGYSYPTIWWNNLLYSQPPPGLNIRLTIDKRFQQLADAAIGDHTGALVLMNAKSGEILAMASHPYFDPGRLGEDWSNLSQDLHAPLVNRAALGLYSPGTALGPFILAEGSSRMVLPSTGSIQPFTAAPGTVSCSEILKGNPSLGSAVSAGCPGPSIELARQLGSAELLALFTKLGFFQAPDTYLPSTSQPALSSLQNLDLAAVGLDKLLVSPLQMAMAASALTSGGVLPAPRTTISVNIPNQGWTVLPQTSSSQTVFSGEVTAATIAALSSAELPTWYVVGTALNNNAGITWYLGGTKAGWQGNPLAVALVFEENDPSTAKQAGEMLFRNAMSLK